MDLIDWVLVTLASGFILAGLILFGVKVWWLIKDWLWRRDMKNYY